MFAARFVGILLGPMGGWVNSPDYSMVFALPFRTGRWEGEKGVNLDLSIKDFDDGNKGFSSSFPCSDTTNPTMVSKVCPSWNKTIMNSMLGKDHIQNTWKHIPYIQM